MALMDKIVCCKQKSKSNENGINGNIPKESKDISRGHWANQWEFFLSSLGYAVGLGNIWRFPYLCMRNGGGAFLIPYFLALLVIGIPSFCMEICVGQFSGKSPIQLWNDICPLMKGVGLSTCMITTIICTYYNVIICWTLYFTFKSFAKSLPWSSCGNTWNTPYCMTREVAMGLLGQSNVTGGDYQNSSHLGYNTGVNCMNSSCSVENITYTNDTGNLGYGGATTEPQNIPWKTPSEEFWLYNVLDISNGVLELNGIKWDLFGFLFLAWIITFLCLCRGVKSSGKVVYVTATVPYLFITALLVRGVTLPGATEGLKYYLLPDWKKLATYQVWAEATLQVIYTLGPGWGGVLVMSSYNKFNHNCVRDGVLVPLMTCLTSFYGGFIIFSVLGFMAQRANIPIQDIVATGPGLVFVVYPEAVSHLPISPLWAICFFCVLLSVGLDSMFGTLEVLTSSIIDMYPNYLRKYKTPFIGVICLFFFLCGIVYITRGGMYVFQLMDWYIVIPLLYVVLLEFVTIAWIYGTKRLNKDIQMMTGKRPSAIWGICWRFVSPFVLCLVIIYTFTGFTTPTYNGNEYPSWLLAIVWMINIVPIVTVPVCSILALYKMEGPLRQRIKDCLKASPSWGPADLTGVTSYDSPKSQVLLCKQEQVEVGDNQPLKDFS